MLHLKFKSLEYNEIDEKAFFFNKFNVKVFFLKQHYKEQCRDFFFNYVKYIELDYACLLRPRKPSQPHVKSILYIGGVEKNPGPGPGFCPDSIQTLNCKGFVK